MSMNRLSHVSTAFRFIQVFASAVYYFFLSYIKEWRSGSLSWGLVHSITRAYSRRVLASINCDIQCTGAAPLQTPVLFIGNHLSYVDIPLLMALAPVVFVAKQEVGRMPIIGACARRAGTVLVKRESQKSRRAALEAIRAKMMEGEQSVAIFPSGTTSMTEAKPWRRGPFMIAAEIGCVVQAFRVRYDRMRAVAYIDQDILPIHLWKLIRGGKFTATIEFAPPRVITDPERDCEEIWNWCREFVANPSTLTAQSAESQSLATYSAASPCP